MANWIRIYKRSEWGAKYGIGWGDRPLPCKYKIIHHTETNQLSPNATFAQDAAEIRYVEYIGYTRFRQYQAGWTPPKGPGISYTWLVTPSGRVFEGHDVSLESSHTKGYNRTGVGIALVGNYENNQVTDAQIESVARLLLQAVDDGYIDKADISGGHRDFVATTCPGRNGYAAMDKIEKRIAQLSGQPTTGDDYYWANDKDYVIWVQTSLKELGYYFGEVDGSAGPKTRLAVSEFQEDNGLDPDGEAGPKTKGAIEIALDLIAWKADEDYVRWVQDSLSLLGFYHGPVDGHPGNDTVSAVENFQSAHGLKVDGSPGGQTRSVIESELQRHRQIVDSARLGGKDSTATAVLVATADLPPGRGILIAALASNDMDAAANRAGGNIRTFPVTLGKDAVRKDVLDAIRAYKPEWIRIVGGRAAVTDRAARAVFLAAGLL